jgi:hypothetical protein
MCRLVQELKVYFTLRQAIRISDLSVIQKLIPILAVTFYGTGKENYGLEMLWLYWILSPEVSSKSLRETIRHSLLVKQTVSGNYTGVDHAVELLNCACKIDLKVSKNSTHTVESSIGYKALTAPYNKRLRLGLEQALGVKYSPAHSRKKNHEDIMTVTLQLLSGGHIDRRRK